MMSVEERIRYLLRAALRAEIQGDSRVARNLRRMADEARPAATGARAPMLPAAGMERCPE